MDNKQFFYPEFDHPASQLSAFAFSTSGFFTISLKNGQIINFTPDNTDYFYNWLITHNIRDAINEKINEEETPATPKRMRWNTLFKNEKMKNEQIIRVAIIDDHDLLRNGICQFLDSFGFALIFEVENGVLALEKIERSHLMPDVCIVDVNMPVMNGFELTEILNEKYPAVKIVAFSVNDDEKDVLKMLECGADGYVLKGADPDELKKAIEVVYNGKNYFSAGVSKIAEDYFNTI